MPKFLNTSGITYHLEELIKDASERLILISPYLKLNDKIKELLEDKNRFKIDVRIIYGKSELQPEEINWIKELSYVRTSFCKNLHAKCYLNESSCIITSLNLYEFSQVNNNEMGILISRDEDSEVYKDTYAEAQRIIRVSDEVRISLEKVKESDEKETPANKSTKLTSSKIAKKFGLKTADFITKVLELGYIEEKDGKQSLTKKGEEVEAEFKVSKRFGDYFIWPESFEL
jgi:phosphatidylserine/phosphatidylglycerophosphate/cardiolipin synthase-like enzyme